MRGRFVLLAVVAFAVVAEMALRQPGRAQLHRPAAAPATRAPLLAAGVAEALPALPPAPRSLLGTDVDGTLAVDARGDLVVSPELRRFYEYFLSTTGEEPES